MPCNKVVKPSFTQRRRVLIKKFDLCEFAMQACANCRRTSKFDKCKIEERFDKCIECVKFNIDCDLTSFNSVK